MDKVKELEKRLKQGSVELQGEAGEVSIEKTLRELFPFDEESD